MRTKRTLVIETRTKSLVKKILLFSLLLMATLAISTPALAACGKGDAVQYRRLIVTYYEARYDSSAPFDSRGTLVKNDGGSEYYRIRLRGIVYYPCASVYLKTAKFPAIIVNHGSGAEFEADNKHWQIAIYFVPKGYIVFAPFRRGQGDDDAPHPNDPDLSPNHISDKSTGVYVEDILDDWTSGTPKYVHDTPCQNRSCYKAQLLKEQADEKIAAAIEYLKGRADVKKDPVDPKNPDDPPQYRIGIMGLSYGGAVTVFANRNSMGQRVVVAFSPRSAVGPK